jgi:acyl-coenzyme A synthetase/AMP-(fatty) acid ligase
MNVTDVIWRNSHAWPTRPAVLMGSQVVSYSALRKLSGLISARLALAGVRRGDGVAVALRDPLIFLATIFATARLGAVASPLRADLAEANKSLLLARHKARFLVHHSTDAWRSPDLPAAQHLDVQSLVRPPSEAEQLTWPTPVTDADAEPWYIALTSGTTGLPKSVPQTHANGIRSACLNHDSEAPQRVNRLLVFADMGIQLSLNVVMRQLYAGATLVLSAALDSAEFFRQVEQHRPQRAITSSGIAARLVEYAAQQLPDSASRCSSLQSVVLAGSQVPPAVRDGFRQRICAQQQVSYGSTEAGPMAFMTAEMFDSHPDSTGRVLPWVELQVVDANGQPLGVGQVGTLRVKTPTMAAGYLADPQASAQAFRDGWYYPGDHAMVDTGGYLHLKGRVDQLLNLGGNKLDPEAIEKVLNSYPQVFESAVTGVSSSTGRPLLVALLVADDQIDIGQLRQWCAEWLNPNQIPGPILKVKALPKNAGGKIDRAALAGMLQVVAAKPGADA